jgi:hypothetical protein
MPFPFMSVEVARKVIQVRMIAPGGRLKRTGDGPVSANILSITSSRRAPPVEDCNTLPGLHLQPSSVFAKVDISVSMTPGATALTRMPRGPSAEAKCFTSVSIAPLVAA